MEKNEQISKEMKKRLEEPIRAFSLPQYYEIPDVGLYLEQVAKYLSGYLAPFSGIAITGSMISNYVKKKLLKSPVRKQYDREQIAVLFVIAIAKSVLSIDDTRLLVEEELAGQDTEAFYQTFRESFSGLLRIVFESGENDGEIAKLRGETSILRKVMIAAAYKAYLDNSFALRREKAMKQEETGE